MVHIQNLSFGYTGKKLLYNNLTLSLEKGKIYGLLGKNGAGKSTFLKNLSGMLFPSGGHIFINGQEPRRRLPSFLEDFYFIPEEVYVPSVSIERYTKIFSPFYPKFDCEKFRIYLEMLEVEPAVRLKSMSFGQQKKFIIAFALACNTSLLLLDEPTNGLDIPSKAQFRQLIASVMTENRIILISTHQTRDLENLIDTVLILDNGNLLLHEPVYKISQVLSFKIVQDLPDNRLVLFSEPAFGGYAVVMENLDQEEDQISLEHLFNAVIYKPDMIRKLFQPLKPVL